MALSTFDQQSSKTCIPRSRHLWICQDFVGFKCINATIRPLLHDKVSIARKKPQILLSLLKKQGKLDFVTSVNRHYCHRFLASWKFIIKCEAEAAT